MLAQILLINRGTRRRNFHWLMQRLFFALPIPSTIREQLALLRPPPSRAVKPIAPDQMHVTMHFIGEAEPASAAKALTAVQLKPFTLRFDHFGSFGSARRGGILWVGTEPHPLLDALHHSLGVQLEQLAYPREARPFTPHVTLARCRRGCSTRVFRSFVDTPVPELPPLPVEEVVLYSSRQTQQGSVYHPEFVQILLRSREIHPHAGAERKQKQDSE